MPKGRRMKYLVAFLWGADRGRRGFGNITTPALKKLDKTTINDITLQCKDFVKNKAPLTQTADITIVSCIRLE